MSEEQTTTANEEAANAEDAAAPPPPAEVPDAAPAADEVPAADAAPTAEETPAADAAPADKVKIIEAEPDTTPPTSGSAVPEESPAGDALPKSILSATQKVTIRAPRNESESDSDYDDDDDGHSSDEGRKVSFEALTGSVAKDSIYDRDSSSPQSDSEMSVRTTASFAMDRRVDFFDVLGEIPDLEEISLDISMTESMLLRPSKADLVSQQSDVGRFVDPLTGQNIDDESSEEAQPEPVVEQVEEEEEEKEDDDLLVPEIEEDIEMERRMSAEDVFETFLEMEAPKKVHVEDEVDFEKLAREEEARQMQITTENFVNELITKAVDKAEYVDPKTILRQNLDKGKLMLELESKLLQLDVEQKTRFFLNRKTVEYFRRKKAFRAIQEDNPETVGNDIAKYRNAIKNMDLLLGKEEETRQVTNLKIENLESELFDREAEARQEEEKLETLVRKTLVRENFEKLKVVVENQLKRMADTRSQITELRLVLIQRQHTLATLAERLEKLENLGNGLRMRDFEALQTETQALGKKIEERNSELGKLRTRCNADLHIMAHMKERQQMLRTAITIQETALHELNKEKQFCRKSLYNLKMDRGRVRKEIQDLSFQGGLLDKPALMRDYDETSEKLELLRARVDQLKAKYAEVQQKLVLAEQRQHVLW